MKKPLLFKNHIPTQSLISLIVTSSCLRDFVANLKILWIILDRRRHETYSDISNNVFFGLGSNDWQGDNGKNRCFT